MKRFVLLAVVLVPVAFIVHSCSLLKVSADLGVKPLSPKDLNTRVAVRAYASNFTDVVAAAADSVFARAGKDTVISPAVKDSVKLASIRWKRNASSAGMNTSLNSIPEGALLNTWILVKGMREMDWDSYFGPYGFAGVQTSEFLLEKYKEVISPFLNPAKYTTMEKFVDSVIQAAPLDMRFKTEDYTYEWFKYSGVPDSLLISTVGSISEVIADLNDRVGKYSVNVSNQLEWGKQQLEYQVGMFLSDSTNKAALDSLNASVQVLKGAIKSAPGKVDSLINDVNIRIDKLIGRLDYTVNHTMDNAFIQLAAERAALTKYLSEERAAIMSEGKVMLDDSVVKLTESVDSLIKNLLIYFVLFVLLLVGVPFYVGYRIGRGRNAKVLKNERN